jgi:hypothetical protein
MNKKAYITELTYDISDIEKQQAEKALIFFDTTAKLLSKAADHLNIMKTPFKESPDMDSNSVMNSRAALRRFRDKVVDNFNEFKHAAFKCVHIMQKFATDTQTVKLMKSFISTIDILESKVNLFVALFDDLQSKDFSKDIVSIIEDIQKEASGLDDIIDNRIKSHIQTNILAKSWADSVSDELQLKIEKETPLMIDLFNKNKSLNFNQE